MDTTTTLHAPQDVSYEDGHARSNSNVNVLLNHLADR